MQQRAFVLFYFYGIIEQVVIYVVAVNRVQEVHKMSDKKYYISCALGIRGG